MKEFFKITTKKIVFCLILLFLTLVLLEIDNPIKGRTYYETFNKFSFINYIEIIFSPVFFIIIFLDKGFNILGSNYETFFPNPITILIFLIIQILYSYFLSCLIIYLLNKKN